jgi:ABC-type spermidine/putrescine transport system permease subunit II
MTTIVFGHVIIHMPLDMLVMIAFMACMTRTMEMTNDSNKFKLPIRLWNRLCHK